MSETERNETGNEAYDDPIQRQRLKAVSVLSVCLSLFNCAFFSPPLNGVCMYVRQSKGRIASAGKEKRAYLSCTALGIFNN